MDNQLLQVRSVSTDMPSAVLFAALQQVLPRLETLALDPVHISMAPPLHG